MKIKGEVHFVQLQSIPCPHPSIPSFFFFSSFCPDSGWWRCSQGSGLSRVLSRALSLSLSRQPPAPLSLALYKWRLSVFIVQRVTQQPADGGLPWPRWTSGASFRNRHSLAQWLTATQAGVHHIITAEVFCCAGLCVCFCLSDFSALLWGVYQTQEKKPSSKVVACSWN